MKRFIKNEMVYSDRIRIKPVILAQGEINGIEFVILNEGKYPVSYIKVIEGSKWSNGEIGGVSLHGGPNEITSLKANLKLKGKYAKFPYYSISRGDYVGGNSTTYNGKKWTTEELLDELLDLIVDILNNKREYYFKND